MKKKFIDIETYKNIEKNSITAVERELQEAAALVGNIVGDTGLEVYCISENQVTFVKNDGNYVQANYEVQNDKIILEGIEELVVEQNALGQARKDIIGKMVDNILSEKNELANANFSEYFSLPVVRAGLREGVIAESTVNEGKLPKGLADWQKKHGNPLKKKHDKKNEKMSSKDKKKAKKDSLLPDKKRFKKVADEVKKKKGEAKLDEWNYIARNILEFVDFRNNGAVYQNAKTQSDNKGNVVSIAVPRTHLRNEGKILMMQYKDMANVMHCRMEALKEDYNSQSNWVRAINDIKRFNAVSDHNGLQTAFENVVAVWPNLLYLKKDELASKINETLTISGARNFDDEVCEFLAEGIIRTAHKTYSDRVGKLFNIAGKQADSDDFDAFSVVSEAVYKKVDADAAAELQVFKDLYRSLSEVNKTSKAMGDERTNLETQSLLKVCENVLNHSAKADLEVAEDLALYLETLTESVNFEGGSWQLMQPHVSTTGDNPFIHKYADENGAPGAHTGPYKASPMSDGKNVKVDVEDYYTGMKGSELSPNVSNPYAPKPGDFKMHGEKTVGEDSDDLATSQGGDTWPNLKNPYLPDHGMTLADSMKLLDGKY